VLSTAVTYVRLTGVYVNESGGRISGTVRFTPSQALVDVETEKIVVPRTRGSVLRTGVLDISLPATDDPGLSPQNWHYRVVEDFPGGRTFDLQLPSDLIGTTLNLADFVPMDLVPPDLQGTIRGPKGDPGPAGPPGTLPVQIGGAMPTDPAIVVWYEVL
jgi:hypothetical protein